MSYPPYQPPPGHPVRQAPPKKRTGLIAGLVAGGVVLALACCGAGVTGWLLWDSGGQENIAEKPSYPSSFETTEPQVRPGQEYAYEFTEQDDLCPYFDAARVESILPLLSPPDGSAVPYGDSAGSATCAMSMSNEEQFPADYTLGQYEVSILVSDDTDVAAAEFWSASENLTGEPLDMDGLGDEALATADTTNGKTVTVLARNGNLMIEARFFVSDKSVLADEVMRDVNIDSVNEVMNAL